MWSYWGKIARRAHKKTLEMLGYGQLSRAWISILIFLVALILIRLISGPAQMSDEWKWGLAIVGSLITVYLPLFVWNFMRSPNQIDQEKTSEIDDLRRSIREKILKIAHRTEYSAGARPPAIIFVDVCNETNKTIKNVTASISKIYKDREPIQIQSIIGSLLELDVAVAVSSPSISSVDVHPGQRVSFRVTTLALAPGNCVFDIARTERLQAASGQVIYKAPGLTAISSGHHAIVIVVRGEDAQPVQMTLDLQATENVVEVAQLDGARELSQP